MAFGRGVGGFLREFGFWGVVLRWRARLMYAIGYVGFVQLLGMCWVLRGFCYSADPSIAAMPGLRDQKDSDRDLLTPRFAAVQLERLHQPQRLHRMGQNSRLRRRPPNRPGQHRRPQATHQDPRSHFRPQGERQRIHRPPRIITLGGDHTTTLPALRSTHAHWGPVSVIHFDSHIDTWDPSVIGGGLSHYAGVNHGTFLHIAHEEGLVLNSSAHAGIRAPVANRKYDLKHDRECGFRIVTAREIDKVGTEGVIKALRERVRGTKVYISVDIDVLDPAFAPATGTAEVGGWTTRELLTILDGLSGLEVVGADVGEFEYGVSLGGVRFADTVHS